MSRDNLSGSSSPIPARKQVIFSMLDPAQKELYYEFLVEKNVQFTRELDAYVPKSYYVAAYYFQHRRLFELFHKCPCYTSEGTPSKTSTVSVSRTPRKIVLQGVETGIPFNYMRYAKLCTLLDEQALSTARQRPLSWLLKHINSIYDAYLRREQAEPHWQLLEDVSVRVSRIFPVFVHQFLTKQFGLKHITDQTGWDLLHSVEMYRQQSLDVEIFAAFVAERYGYDDLVFFLNARQTATTVVMNCRQKSPDKKGISLMWKHCIQAARLIFPPDEHNLLLPAFVNILETYVAGRRKKPVELTEFLNLVLLHYHEAAPPPETSRTAIMDQQRIEAARAQRDQLISKAEVQYESRIAQLESAKSDASRALDLVRERRYKEMVGTVLDTMERKGWISEDTKEASHARAESMARSLLAKESQQQPLSREVEISTDFAAQAKEYRSNGRSDYLEPPGPSVNEESEQGSSVGEFLNFDSVPSNGGPPYEWEQKLGVKGGALTRDLYSPTFAQGSLYMEDTPSSILQLVSMPLGQLETGAAGYEPSIADNGSIEGDGMWDPEEELLAELNLPAKFQEVLKHSCNEYVDILLRSGNELPADMLAEMKEIAVQQLYIRLAATLSKRFPPEVYSTVDEELHACSRALISANGVRDEVEPLVTTLVLQGRRSIQDESSATSAY